MSVAVAVEHRGVGKDDGRPIPGRSAMSVISDVGAESVRNFLREKIKLESALVTDRFASYTGLSARGFSHAAIPMRDDPEMARRFFPWVHIMLSNLKRFLLGTHHKPQAKHLGRYVAEFTYRLNGRWHEANLFAQLTQACLSTNTITYRDLVATPEQAR